MAGRPKGLPKTGGRVAGKPSKKTAEVREIALLYTADAMKELARLAVKAESEQARVSAIKELLDRAYGKSPQAITGEGGGPVQLDVGWLDVAG